MADWVGWAVSGALVGGFVWFKTAGRITGAQAKELVSAGAVLLDVRTAAEFGAGHVPGAKNIPVSELGGRLAEVGASKAKPVVVYCASGTRSAVARTVLRRAGYEVVFNLGSMSRWGPV